MRIHRRTGVSIFHRSLRQQLRDSARAARMACRSRAVILMYHRVASPEMDPLLLCVSPDHYAAQMDILKNRFRPLTLGQLGDAIRAGGVPDRSVVVTFDDGYADNLAAAAPVLSARNLQATLFAAGACLKKGHLYFDELEDLFFRTRVLPPTLSIRTQKDIRTWVFGGWARRPAKLGSGFFQWNLGQKDDPTPRHRAFREIFQLLRSMDHSERERILQQLRRAIDSPAMRSRRLLTARQLRAAASSGVFEIGAHTHRHLVLSAIPVSGQREEILTGKKMLEAALGHPVVSFAYPYGSPWDVSRQSVALVKEAGFALACANTPAPVDGETDPYWLPRFIVRDWTGEEFADRLEGFFHPRAEMKPQG
jgi:peptidoglycan/xylan/chitin deacetylase (PgdA/CDA1 family)